MSDVKFCKDCKFAKVNVIERMIPGFGYRWAKCTQPDIGPNKYPAPEDVDYLVIGGKKKTTPRFFYASTNREYDCGREGRYFEPKKP